MRKFKSADYCDLRTQQYFNAKICSSSSRIIPWQKDLWRIMLILMPFERDLADWGFMLNNSSFLY
jgi:hypothetical protein